MKTLIWDRGELIPLSITIEDVLRFHDDKWWDAASELTILRFGHRLSDYFDNLLDRHSKIHCASVTEETSLGAYDGFLVTAHREKDYLYVYLHKPGERMLVLYAHCEHLFPTITFAGDDFVWTANEIAKEFWKEYAWRLWDKWRSQSDYITIDDVSVIDVEIRQMMEEERWRSAMLFADCVCQMAMAKEDMLMHDYFAKIRDGLRQVLLTD